MSQVQSLRAPTRLDLSLIADDRADLGVGLCGDPLRRA